VVLNHHMVPVSGPAADFDVAYHLGLLSVHYMTEDGSNSNSNPEPPYFSPKQPLPTSGGGVERVGRAVAHNASYAESEEEEDEQSQTSSLLDHDTTINITATTASYSDPASTDGDDCDSDAEERNDDDESSSSSVPSTSLNATLATKSPADNPADNDDMVAAATSQLKDAALEAAMKHAHEVGTTNRGFTRAMVIRAYPQPWHVFVDTSPDTDADFEVAALFDKEPSSDEVNRAIVECLEGSEREDELVAQQMQQALEAGQLDRISEMLWEMGLEDLDEDEDEDDEDDPYRDIFGADTV